jgi:DNA mismatch repair ATPase MutS
VPRSTGVPVLRTTGLYDVGLSINLDGRAVGNDIAADGKHLIMITGANQGGKSTILRAIGTAQLMMQSGLFAPARSFTADVRDGLFTHFKREEDEEMESGKLDEELARMDGIVRAMVPGSMILLNESFSSTNEQEGSEIAGQILRAFADAGVKVVFVTHLFDLADGLYRGGDGASLFLRAERGVDGARTYRIVEGEPLSTSYGEDVYRSVFPDG